MEPVTQDELITIEQVMAILKIGKNTAYRLLDNKEIEALKKRLPSFARQMIFSRTHSVFSQKTGRSKDK